MDTHFLVIAGDPLRDSWPAGPGNRQTMTLIVASQPSPQGDLQLGDLAGPALAMDALARVLRQRGDSVSTLIATSEPFSERNLATLQALRMEPDSWAYPTELEPLRERLRAAGHLDGDLVFPLEPWLPRLRQWVSALSLPGWLDEIARKLWDEPAPSFRLDASRAAALALSLPPPRELIVCCPAEETWDYLSIAPALWLALATPLPAALIAERPSRGQPTGAEQARQFLSADFIRLGLAADPDFHLDALAERADSGWDSWFELVMSWAADGIPDARGEWTLSESSFHQELQRLWQDAEEHRQPATFSLRRQVQLVEELALRGQRFAELHYASGSPVALALACTSLGIFARLAQPIMPELGSALAASVGMPLVADPTIALAPAGRVRPLEVSLATRAQVAALAVRPKTRGSLRQSRREPPDLVEGPDF